MFDGEGFNPRELNELTFIKQYQLEIANRFATFENLCDDQDINRVWETIEGNINSSDNIGVILHEL